MLSGRMHVRMDNGDEVECKPGEATVIPPGHDAWVVGNDTVEFLDFSGVTNYAKQG
jgi:mannose-6-phosphate isomerase-like protein (cupin superfamily)